MPTAGAPGTQPWMLVANILQDSMQKATGVDVSLDNKLVITDVDKQTLQQVLMIGGNNCKVGVQSFKFQMQTVSLCHDYVMFVTDRMASSSVKRSTPVLQSAVRRRFACKR